VHYSDSTKTINYVMVDWQCLLPLGDRLTPEILESEAPAVGWQHVYGSGKPVPSNAESAVCNVWRQHGGS
jgi:hypothetical protein